VTSGWLADPAVLERLRAFIASAAQAPGVEISRVHPLQGGAIQENWALDVEIDGGERAGRHALVLRADAPSRVAASHRRADEFALIAVAHAAGVTVPEPYWLCTDPEVIGRAFYLMRRMPGVAAGHRLVKETTLGGPREALAERLGRELARIHAITPQSIAGFAGRHSYDFLGAPSPNPALDRVALYRRWLDELEQARPALEWSLRWLELHARSAAEVTLVHQDFRTGNYLVDEHGLTAILDWEFCAWGDPLSDIGWFCAECWRFGAADREAGGIAKRAPFYRGYEEASGRRIDPAAVHYWEVAAHVRWAVIAPPLLGPGEVAGAGADRTHGRRARAGDPGPCRRRPGCRGQGGVTIDRPDSAALLEEARRTLLERLLPLLPTTHRYDALMVANAMAIAARESVQGGAACRDLLPALTELTGAGADGGAADRDVCRQLIEGERRLAQAIRAGVYDASGPARAAVRRYLRAAALARVRISNPKAIREQGMEK
jgi:aminoglycoside phosphotransferase (APT) family kinase protein